MKTFIQLMLEVRTSQTYGDEKSLYSVDKIIRKSQIKRANTRKVSDLVSLNSDLTNDEGHFGKLLKNPTPAFMARVKKADTRFPIHIDTKGNIIDGSHRLAKLHFAGQKHAKVHVVGSRTLDKTKIDEADVMPGRTARRSRIEDAADATKKKIKTALAIGGTVAALGGIGWGLHATKDARPDMNDTKPDTSSVYKLTPKEEAERKKLHDTLIRNGEIYRESVDRLPLFDREGKKYIKTGLLGRIKQALTTASSITRKPSVGPSERPTVDPNERRRRNSRGGTYQGNLTDRGIGVVDESHILDQPAVTTEPGGRHPDIVVDNTKERERGWNWDRKQDSGTPDAYDSAIEYWNPDSTVRTDIKHTRGDATKRPNEVGSSHVEVLMNGDWHKSRNGFKLPGDAGAQIDVAKAHLEHHIRTWKPHTISYSTPDPRKDMFYRAYLGKHHPHIKIINRYELEPVKKIRSLNRWIGSREKEIEAERSEAQRRQDALHASARSFVSSQVDEAAKTTGEYRKAALDAAAREAAYRKSVAPRQKKLQGKPIKLRKKTMAEIEAGFKAHEAMKDEHKLREPTSWSPSRESQSTGGYTEHGHRVRDERGAWSFGSTGPLGDGMDNPPDLWFSHGGDHLAIHSAVNRGNPTGGQLHSDLPGFHRAEGQDPLIQGRIDHARKRITYLSLQTRASGFGERVINAQKRRMANRLAKKYPGYTHHDSDNNQEPF